MTRGNREADYSAATQIMKSHISNFQKPSDFTWHHMDDLEIINGEPYCTMQLVKTNVHGAAGMRHSGAVAQLERFLKNEIFELIDND